MKNSKLTPEERADEIIGRFYKLNDDPIFTTDESDPYISRRGAILCAIELANEAIFISSKDYNAEWSNRREYWVKIRSILESKLQS